MGCRKTVMFVRTGTTFLLCFFPLNTPQITTTFWSAGLDYFLIATGLGLICCTDLADSFLRSELFVLSYEEAFGKDYTAWLLTTWSVSKKYQSVCLMTKVKSNITFVSQAFNRHVLFFLLGDFHFKTTSRNIACDEDRILRSKGTLKCSAVLVILVIYGNDYPSTDQRGLEVLRLTFLYFVNHSVNRSSTPMNMACYNRLYVHQFGMHQCCQYCVFSSMYSIDINHSAFEIFT